LFKLRALPLLLVLFTAVSATHYEPWFEPDLLPQITGKYTFQTYPRIKVGRRSLKRHSTDHFVGAAAYLAGFNDYCGELEVNTADTDAHSYGFENVKLTARYLLMDDIQGDPVSLAVGASASYASIRFVRDLGAFHHGRREYFGHLAVGKEWDCGPIWVNRVWGHLGFGVADQGSPWMNAEISYAENRMNRLQYRFFLNTLVGFGDRDIPTTTPFKGYGAIQHRSVDTGIEWSYLVNDCFTVGFQYAYRLWAYNFPAQNHRITLQVMYPYPL